MRERRTQRARLADPRCPQRSRRAAPAVPAVLHRSCASCRRRSSAGVRRSSASILFVIANFAYQAALIYYDATLKTREPPGDARPPLGDRRRDRLRRHDLRRAVPAGPRRGASRTGSSSPPSCSPCSPSRSSCSSASRGRSVACTIGDVFGSLAQLRTSVRHAREVPGLLRFLVGPVLLLGRGQHDHRRDDDRDDAGQGAVRPDGPARPARPHGRGDLRQLRLGPAGRPAGAATDADDRAGLMGRRADPRGRLAQRRRPDRAWRCSSSPAGSSGAASAASRWPTAC